MVVVNIFNLSTSETEAANPCEFEASWAYVMRAKKSGLQSEIPLKKQANHKKTTSKPQEMPKLNMVYILPQMHAFQFIIVTNIVAYDLVLKFK